MEKVKVKALRIFASGETIFFPYKEPYIVTKDMAELWEKSGHCKIVEYEPFESDKEPSKPNTSKGEEKAEDDGENAEKAINYDELDYNELKFLAKEAGIKGYNTMKKAKLISALKGE